MGICPFIDSEWKKRRRPLSRQTAVILLLAYWSTQGSHSDAGAKASLSLIYTKRPRHRYWWPTAQTTIRGPHLTAERTTGTVSLRGDDLIEPSTTAKAQSVELSSLRWQYPIFNDSGISSTLSDVIISATTITVIPAIIVASIDALPERRRTISIRRCQRQHRQASPWTVP